MTIYKKILSIFGLIRTLIGLRALRQELALPFDERRTYTPGRMTVYNNELYKCVSKHTGVWSESDFALTTVDDAIYDLIVNVVYDTIADIGIRSGVEIHLPIVVRMANGRHHTIDVYEDETGTGLDIKRMDDNTIGQQPKT